MYQERFESIVSYFSDNYADELAKARTEFFEATGEVFEDDPFIEGRIANYLEWFVVDRPVFNEISAVEYYLKDMGPSLSEDDRETAYAIGQCVHSLFEVKKLDNKKKLVTLLDLADRAKYQVTERRSLAGLNKGDVIEVRLLLRGEKVHFMQAFVIHPPATSPFLRKQMKLFRKSDNENLLPILLAWQKCWMQVQRYRHVDPLRFYNDASVEAVYGA